MIYCEWEHHSDTNGMRAGLMKPGPEKRRSRMRNWKAALATLIFLLLPVYSYSSYETSAPPPALGEIRISLLDGDVQMKTEETGEWVPVALNTPLREGDSLWIPDGGRLELQLSDGTYMRLDERTSVDVLRVERDSFQFYLATGRAYVNFRGLKNRLLQIDTPVSSTRVYEKSTFRIDVTEEGRTDISVFKGSLYAEARNGKTRVYAGKSLSLRDDAYAELSSIGPADEWERWNRERDGRLFEKRYSAMYLPDELDYYSYDFDEYGKWVYVRDYGYCWTPVAAVSAGWAPYRMGRWVWRGADYVWISYEPWGWVPYHYGRWAHIASIGWCWVPPARGAVYWGPGYVGWVYTTDYVAWVPLAPGDVYYGYGYFGPSSVNIINIDIVHIDRKIAYRNAFLAGAVTIVSRNTFVTGRHTDIRISENPFRTVPISIGRPDIKPERSTLVPVLKDIPRLKEPPRIIREIRSRELRERRPLVKDRSLSVLRPEAPQRSLPLRQKESRPAGRDVEKRRDIRPSGRDLGGPRESGPSERGVEKRREAPALERGLEMRREVAPAERGIEKREAPQPAGKAMERRKESKQAGPDLLKPAKPQSEERGAVRQREAQTPSKGDAVKKHDRPLKKTESDKGQNGEGKDKRESGEQPFRKK